MAFFDKIELPRQRPRPDGGCVPARLGRGAGAGVPESAWTGEPLTQEEELAAFQTGFLRFVAGEYCKRLGWVMQLHYGCRRNNNTRMFRYKLGRDTGYDCIVLPGHALPGGGRLSWTCWPPRTPCPAWCIYSLESQRTTRA